MSKQSIPTSLAPEVIIEQVGGNLQVKGWDEPEVFVEADPTTLTLEEQDDVVRLSCAGNCEVRLPSGAAVQVGNAHGEARFRLLEDSLKVENVHGSLYLRNVAETGIKAVHGELLARQVAGNLNVDSVHGNAIVRDIQGNCLLEDIHGNLDLHDVEGDIKAAMQGNARVRLSVISGSRYEIQADGNLHCRLPVDASLRLNLNSDGEYISVKAPEGLRLYQQEHCELTLGEGCAEMNLTAGGSIYVSVREADKGDDEDQPGGFGFEGFTRIPDDFSEQIARQVESQIEAQMEAMNRQLNEQMANLSVTIGKSGMSPEETERIMRRARERSERATAQAQEKVRRAQEKIERKIEAERRREEQRAGQTGWNVRFGRKAWHGNFPPPPPPPPRESVSEEERLMILRMLEQKKITLEEAEELLSSLEGKER
jgi:hypothetical protein